MEVTNCCDYKMSKSEDVNFYPIDRHGIKVCDLCFKQLDENVQDRLLEKAGYTMSAEESLKLLND
jgi:hypothetical protein